MPVVYQSGSNSPSGANGKFTFCDLVPLVAGRVENRTQDQNLILTWIRDAVIELSTNGTYRDDFIELEIEGPLYNLTANQQEYEESNFVPVGDVNKSTLDFRIWQDPPNNSFWVKVQPTHYQRSDEASVGPSLSLKWYRFGSKIGFYPIPDQPYQVQARLLRMHPIDNDDLCNTEILLPVDWNEIIVWAAAQRGFMYYEQYEKAGQIHTFLWGDPNNSTNPGLAAGRIKKRQDEAFRQQRQLRPVVRRLTIRG